MSNYIATTLPKNWSVNTRMYLSQQNVAELLPYLQRFVETGDLD